MSPKTGKVSPKHEGAGVMTEIVGKESIHLTPEEWEYMKSRLTPERPICWFCMHRPKSPMTMEFCDHKPLSRRWKEAAGRKYCGVFHPDGYRIALRRDAKPKQLEQLELGL